MASFLTPFSAGLSKTIFAAGSASFLHSSCSKAAELSVDGEQSTLLVPFIASCAANNNTITSNSSNSNNNINSLATTVMVSPSQTTIRSLPPNNTSAKSSFFVIWDNKTRNPLCTVEKLHKQDFHSQSNDTGGEGQGHSSKHRPPFYADSAIALPFRVHPKDYNDSKYDRGHMTPAADFAHQDSQYKQSFSMSNIAPQAPFMNRGVWERIEAWIRHYLLAFHFEEVVVITGPVYAPTFVDNQWLYIHKTIGTFPHIVTVPTHYFKVILGRPIIKHNSNSNSGNNNDDGDNNEVVVAAFLVPNQNNVPKMEPVSNLLVRLDQLESVVGFQFFPALLNEKDKEKLDAVVPAHRDLSVLLNAQSSFSLSQSLSGTTPFRDVVSMVTAGQDNGSNNNVNISKNSSSIVTNNRKDIVMSSMQLGLRISHLCNHSHVNCQKSMFPSK